MFALPRARITAPIVHACLFTIASLLLSLSDKPVLNGPAAVPVLVLWFADIPLSIVASSILFFSDQYALLTWLAWGVAGTIWWWLMGLSIEAWQRRFARNRDEGQRTV